MPTYQYTCTECSQSLEAVQSFSDPALTECPACEGRLRKVFNSVGIVFKGSGFYRTDSRSGGVGTESAKDGKTDGKTDGKSESKAASKSDASSNGSSGNSGAAATGGSSSNGSSNGSSSNGAAKTGATSGSSAAATS